MTDNQVDLCSFTCDFLFFSSPFYVKVLPLSENKHNCCVKMIKERKESFMNAMAAVPAASSIYDSPAGTMPGGGVNKKVHFAPDYKENNVDIYVSAESLRVYDSPWVEEEHPNSTGPAGVHHTGMRTSIFNIEISEDVAHSACFNSVFLLKCLLSVKTLEGGAASDVILRFWASCVFYFLLGSSVQQSKVSAFCSRI